jgi:nucleoside phosphorylase
MEAYQQPFDVCIICALAEEANAVIEEFSTRCMVSFTKAFSPVNQHEYRHTTIQNNSGEPLTIFVTWLADMGPMRMALDLKPLLQEFRPRFAAMTGICAGDKRKVKLGDLVVVNYAYHHEEGKMTRGSNGQTIHFPETRTAGATIQVIQYARGFDSWREPVREMKRKQLKRPWKPTDEPKCSVEVMTSGMAVRADNPFPQLVERHNRKTVGIEMEAAAFYFALSDFPLIHPLVIKGVSDYGDGSKNDRYRDYAARASAIYLLYFIREYVTEQTMPRRDALPSSARTGASGVWNIPHARNPHFTGRDGLLDQQLSLEAQDDSMITRPVEIETIQSKRHRLRKIKDSIRLLREEGIKNKDVTMPSLKATLEFEERNATILEREIREELRTVHSPLPRQSYTRFIGRKEKLTEILGVLEKRSTLPIVAIDGIGGAGKTALARELAQLSLEANIFSVAVWESDKPTEFTGGGILSQSTDEMSFENLLDRIGRKLGYFDVSSLRTVREKKDLVRHILNAERYLIVIDNLETIKGYRDLVHNLDGMFDNSKAILTTRKKVAEFRDVYPVSLGGMELAESIEFLKSEAVERGEAGRVILEASESLLERIYITTGGLPLAMRLVLGQTTRSSPKTVLKHLEAVNYQKIQNPGSDEDVYNQFVKFIYWDSWNQLSDNGKQLLIELGAFDPTEGARRDFLSTMSELSNSDLDDAASELVEFSLVSRSFEEDQEIFYLHPLTHHFVQHEV